MLILQGPERLMHMVKQHSPSITVCGNFATMVCSFYYSYPAANGNTEPLLQSDHHFRITPLQMCFARFLLEIPFLHDQHYGAQITQLSGSYHALIAKTSQGRIYKNHL